MNYLQVNEAQHSLFHHKVTKQALIPNTVLAHIPIETFVMIKKNQVSLSNQPDIQVLKSVMLHLCDQ